MSIKTILPPLSDDFIVIFIFTLRDFNAASCLGFKLLALLSILMASTS